MGINSQIKKPSLGKIITILITTLGIISGVVGLVAYFQKSNPHLVYQILANTNVFEVKENLGDLDILFRGNNIKKNNEKLVIMTIKVLNDGNANILKNFYDSNDPLGLEISDGIFAETPSVLDASSDYLKNNLNIKQASEKKISFPDLIIEQGDYFTIKTLILSNNYSQPSILPIGKVAGVKQIDVKALYESGSTNNFNKFLMQTFSGGIFTQFFRLVAYFLLGIIIIALLVIASEFIEDKLKKLKRKKVVKMFKQTKDYRTNFTAKIFLFYIEHGLIYLKQINQLINKDGSLQVKNLKPERMLASYTDDIVFKSNLFPQYLLSDLRKSKLTTLKDKKLFIKSEFQKDLNIFLKFLARSKIEKEHDQDYSQPTITIKSG